MNIFYLHQRGVAGFFPGKYRRSAMIWGQPIMEHRQRHLDDVHRQRGRWIITRGILTLL